MLTPSSWIHLSATASRPTKPIVCEFRGVVPREPHEVGDGLRAAAVRGSAPFAAPGLFPNAERGMISEDELFVFDHTT